MTTIKATLVAVPGAEGEDRTFTITLSGLSVKKLYALQEALADKQHKSVHVGKVFEAFQAAQDEFLKAVL